jgi:penicillin-binding protein 1A
LRFFSIISSAIVAWSERPTDIKLKQAAIVGAIGFVAAAFSGDSLHRAVHHPEPAFDRCADRLPAEDSAARLYRGQRADWRIRRRAPRFVPIANVPASLKHAIIAIEDNNFYEHGGVDFLGIVRAGLANMIHSRSQGASTITMQVARTFLLTRKKTYSRKLQEICCPFRSNAI